MLSTYLLLAEAAAESPPALDLNQTGVLGIFAFLVVREILQWTSRRRILNSSCEPLERHLSSTNRILGRQTEILEALEKQLDRTSSRVAELHEWHSPNTSGVQAWRNPRSANTQDEAPPASRRSGN